MHNLRKEVQESCAYSLKVPECSLLEIRTAIVACCEQNAIPNSQELNGLQPIAFILIPGARIHTQTPEQRSSADIMHPPPECDYSLNFFDAVISNMPNVEDIIICTHSECSYPVEMDFEKQLRLTSLCLKRSEQVWRQSVQVHVWHFEPEVNWVSFFDTDTRQMLPLNAAAIFA